MTTNTDALDQLIAQTKTPVAPSAARNNRNGKATPIGNINIKIGGVNVFNRSVWAESTSDSEFLNQLNELAKTDKDKASAIILQLLTNVEVEITTKATSNASLEDLLALTLPTK